MPLDNQPPLSPAALKTAFETALGHADPGAEAFCGQVLDDLGPDELSGFTTADFAAQLAEFWRFGEGYAAGPPRIRLRAGVAVGEASADILEIVQSDAPFLVDSVMGEAAEQRAVVKAMFHPVVGLGRARQSMIQVWLEPLGAARGAALLAAVGEALADVRAAVDDFPAMLG